MIDFDSLPNSFVIKANHGSGFNMVVNNKTELDISAAKKKCLTCYSVIFPHIPWNNNIKE